MSLCSNHELADDHPTMRPFIRKANHLHVSEENAQMPHLQKIDSSLESSPKLSAKEHYRPLSANSQMIHQYTCHI